VPLYQNTSIGYPLSIVLGIREYSEPIQYKPVTTNTKELVL